jgi:hypothetical protein
MVFCGSKGRSDQHRSSEGRFTNQRLFEPMVEEECSDDTPLKPIADHFSPLPIHLSPMPSTINSVSPLVKNIADSVEEEDFFKPLPSSEDGEQTPVEHPQPLVSTPSTKPVAIGAAIARFYDISASETSTSLPHPTPATYYSRRHEKEKEKQRELSRNNSSGGSTGRVALSRIRALQEKLVPESGDEAERTRSNRRQLLNAILADAPTPQSTPAPFLGAGPPPPAPPPPPPPPPRPMAISRASAAAQEIERERERRHRQSSENRAPETPNPTVPPTHHHQSQSQPQPQAQPQPQPPQLQTLSQRLAHPRPSIASLKDVMHSYGGEDGMQRSRPAYPDRRSATTERRPSIGKPQWHRSSPTEA